jgi:hypothetical protein
MDEKPFNRIEPQALSDSMTVVLAQSEGDADVLMCIVDADTGNDSAAVRRARDRPGPDKS